MKHPNIAPSIGKQLIQHLVTSNPSPAYVQRVATAFASGQFQGFGSGTRGDMKATIAAILLDAEARTETPGNRAGRLREPVQYMVGLLRALYGRTDGDPFGGWWGGSLRQYVFRSPSVFNFYPPNFPIAGTDLVGPAFGIHSAATALGRLNYITYLLYWDGSPPAAGVPNAIGTRVDLAPFMNDAPDADQAGGPHVHARVRTAAARERAHGSDPRRRHPQRRQQRHDLPPHARQDRRLPRVRLAALPDHPLKEFP